MKSMSNQADVLVDNWSGKAYHLFKEAVSFEEAMAKCEALGGVPVTYASSSEQVGRTQGGRARWRGLWCCLLLHSAVLSKVSAGLPLAQPLAHTCTPFLTHLFRIPRGPCTMHAVAGRKLPTGQQRHHHQVLAGPDPGWRRELVGGHTGCAWCFG